MFKKLRDYMRQRRAQTTLARVGRATQNQIQTNHTDVSPQVSDDLSIAIRPVDPATGKKGDWEEVKEGDDAGE
jgi:hypothetical protein